LATENDNLSCILDKKMREKIQALVFSREDQNPGNAGQKIPGGPAEDS